MANYWFRVYAEMVDDDKLRLLAFEDRWHYVALLCLKVSGLLDEPSSTLKDRRIATKLGLQLPQLEEVKRRLQEVLLIDDHYQPMGWEKRQVQSDNTDPTAPQRMRRYRNKRNATVTDRNVTPLELDLELEKEVNLNPCANACAMEAHENRDQEISASTHPGIPASRREKSNPADPAFEAFWAAYPKKKSRGTALKAWQSLKPSEPLAETILQAVQRATTSEQWQKAHGQFIPYPASWLRSRGWEDEDHSGPDPRFAGVL